MEIAIMNRINLRQYRPKNSLSFSGRTQGEAVRKELDLEKIDGTDEEIELVIPDDTTSFNPSFFLGLLYASIKKLGLEKFNSKYHLTIETSSDLIKNALQRNIEDGFRNASNSLSNKTGLNLF